MFSLGMLATFVKLIRHQSEFFLLGHWLSRVADTENRLHQVTLEC